MSLAARYEENLAAARRLDEYALMYDIVFVVNYASKGWILEKICKVVAERSGLHCGWLFTERNDQLTHPLPVARAYFFSHYSLACSTLANYPWIFGADRFVWFTHPDPAKGLSYAELAAMANACTHVFTPCSANKPPLLAAGCEPHRISVPLGGADPEMFVGHQRGKGMVGFVGAYYPRKRPDRIIELVRAMPDTQFLLVAPDAGEVVNHGILWQAWDGFGELMSLPNFTYIESGYAHYGEHFGLMDVYVSLSELEGGPIPAIEALMSNVIPVLTRTGFADDIIDHGRNGYVVDIDAPTDVVVAAVRMALADTTTDVRTEALELSWANFGDEIVQRMRSATVAGQQIGFGRGESGVRYLRQGWHDPEADGVWTARSSANCVIPFHTATPGTKHLTVCLWSHAPGLFRSRIVHMLVNGRMVQEIKLTDSRPAVIELAFDLTEDERLEPVRIAFETRTEIATGFGASHTVGIKLAWIRFEDEDSLSRTASTEDQTSAEVQAAIIREINHQPRWTEQQFGFQAGSPFLTGLEGRWHPSEPDGTWTNGPTAAASITMDPRTPKTATLRIEGRVLGANREGGGQLTITLDAGVARPQAHRFLVTDDAVRDFVVPLTMERPRRWSGSLQITFSRTRSFKPSQLDREQKDTRNLGFFLRGVSVEEPAER